MRSLGLLFLLCRCALAADEAPQWARDAAAAQVPEYPAKVNSVVLLQEENVTVDLDNHRVMRERGAIRVLQTSDEKYEASRTYNTKSGRIRDFQGWLIAPSGKVTVFPKNRVIDEEISPQWEETRAKLLEAGSVPPGSVFAWEITEEEKTVFTQYGYRFQERAPVLDSRFVLTLPAAWEVRGTVFNSPPLEPQVNGSTYTWEMRNLPWIEREPHSPSLAAMAPRLMASYFPSAGARTDLEGLKDWTSVSTWLSRMQDPPAEATAPVQAKAAELTAGAASPLDKIKAIAAFVQATNYVSVDMNITRGGGYTPHRAEDTLKRNYGDCKDKATLMRALLQSVGIPAYLLGIYSGDRTYVRAEWASPFQFNHAIVAVKVPESIALPSVIPETPAGRLLIFDPTDPVTPVGDLPRSEQGSYALLVTRENGALLKMPVMAPELNRRETATDASMNADGRIEARLRRDYYGQSGRSLSRLKRMEGNDEVKKLFEAELAWQMTGVALKQINSDTAAPNKLGIDLQFSAERFGQVTGGRLLVVRPGRLVAAREYTFTAKRRTAPIRLTSDLSRDSVRIKVPDGFQLDELPGSARIESPYGLYTATWKVSGGAVVMEESLEIHETVAPASEYAQVRGFFDRVGSARGSAVVLVRQ